jgi:hypothetical protein
MARPIDIVVASPQDVKAEHRALNRVKEELNRGIGKELDMRLEVHQWETDAAPGFHPDGPQALIDAALRIEDCDIFIGILWKKYGTPVADAGSGTIHEFQKAYGAWRARRKPEILFYFKHKASAVETSRDAEQLRRVLEFKEEFPGEGMWWTYRSEREFEGFIREHLTRCLQRLRDAATGSLQSQPEAPVVSRPAAMLDPAAWQERQRDLERRASKAGTPGRRADRNLGPEELRLLSSFRGGTDDVWVPVVALQCITTNLDKDNNLDAQHGPTFRIRLREGFPGAFHAKGGSLQEATRLAVRLRNVPAGVRVAVSGLAGDGENLALALVENADPMSGNGGERVTTSGWKEVVPSHEREATAVYEVILADPAQANKGEIGVLAAWRPLTLNDRPTPGIMQAQVFLLPADESQLNWPGNNVFVMGRCSTVLLFPFVTNQAGFDTGLTIANTSADPLGTDRDVGPCTLFYYGSTTGDGAAPAIQTSVAVPPGNQLVFTLSGGNAACRLAGTPGFQGYIVAVCQFRHASGYAFISNGFGDVPAIASGYLAEVIKSSPGTRGLAKE